MELHAKSLAAAQRTGRASPDQTPLPRRLRDNIAVLKENFIRLARAAKEGRQVTSAGEWFLDNFHVVEEQARQVQRDLPASYYRELPKLSEGHLRGYPRVYGIAWAIIAHSDSLIDRERLERFVIAYQQVTPLKIGELWAIAITLRLALIENLRRLTDAVVKRVDDAEKGRTLAASMPLDQLGSARRALNALDFSPALLVGFEKRLRDEGAGGDQLLRMIERDLNAQGSSSTAIIQDEYQAQSADDVSVRNVINAMRFISNLDWADFFEGVSLVDRALADRTNFRALDFASRDRYRRAVEQIAKQSAQPERDVATAAVELAANGAGRSPREGDIGYYLIARGRRQLERRLGYRQTPRERLTRGAAFTGLWGYLSALGVITTLVLSVVMFAMVWMGMDDSLLVPLALVAALPASDVALALLNRAVTNRWQPQILPGFSFKEGVGPDHATLLVVPTLLTGTDAIVAQVERLEVHYLSNTDANLQFVLLSDWTDSDAEHAPTDEALLQLAQDRIAALNARYPAARSLFVLLHRARRFNPAQGKWMGWERKRGKLHEMHRLLRGADDTTFLQTAEARAILPANVRYIITLDADTRIPRGVAKRLIGKMAHPLNQPVFDDRTGTVVAGHGILQPRVTPSLPIGSESSLFQWAYSGPNGLDPYAFAVSDVYQDLFDEGSFVGKGIYDIDAFERATDGRIPENAILSHDLLEGSLARAALVSDVELVEEFPSRYDVEVSRQHRWVRGDWQLLPWIFGRWSGGAKDMAPSNVSAVGRWKMIDNLRRSLSAPALLLAFLVAWMLPHHMALAWTVLLISLVLVPPFLPLVAGILPRRRGYSLRSHLRNLARDSLLAVTQVLFSMAFLARLAYLALDAISRTLFRLFLSRRYLLEWVTFAQSAYSRRGGWQSTALQAFGSVAFVLAIAVAVGWHATANLDIAAPWLALWGFSPVLARYVSQSPRVEPHLEMSQGDRMALRLAARRTWSFFERFVGVEDNFLPPDNFQEDPAPVIAHRTSPTNIGIYLCAVLAARDFGWIGTVEAAERLEATLETLGKLERLNGHFMNWYDTRSLRSLDPRYISSVDSGNLLGNLLVVKNGFRAMAIGPRPDAIAAGIEDTLGAIRQDDHLLPEAVRVRDAAARIAQMLHARQPFDRARVQAVREHAAALLDGLPPDTHARALRHAQALVATLDSHLRDFTSDLTQSGWHAKLERLAATASEMAEAMDFRFLYDPARQLLSIGYRVDDQALDANVYDLLASEARLASFCAVAKGDVPTSHWFHLGRTLTPLGRIPALQSWSGSMFEYLMPTLLMHEPPSSLLHLSNRAAVRRQIDYLSDRGLPWGISESQYNARDREQNYQYSGFGVPDLGIKRGLGENIVVAPYASGLAAMIAPIPARRNLDRLAALGALGDFGWYEAIDYTPGRLPDGADHVVIKAYMAHHQGMMIVALADVLHDGNLRELFHAEPMVQATELLLQERMPRDVAVARLPPTLTTGAITLHQQGPRPPRRYANPATALPRTHLLSNLHYSVMMTAAGSGCSRWQGIAINRWRPDATQDQWGSFVYLREPRTGQIWSAGFQPVCRHADSYEAQFSEDTIRFVREDGSLTTATEICVSPEDDSEVRRVTVTNNGSRLREIEITSYMELVLADARDDAAHPAFSKLFVETEYVRETGALIAHRRKRDPGDRSIWVAHMSVVDGESVGDVQYETDRYKFLMRGRNARVPGALTEGWPLSNSAGPVLDPCFALRRRVEVPRGKSVSVAFWTLAADSREKLLDLIDRHHDGTAFERATTLAATFARSQLQHLGVVGEEPHLFQALANAIIFPDTAFRARPEVLTQASSAAVALWPLGISGDLPIVLVRVSEEVHVPLVRQMLRARDYWRAKGLASDLVILNERPASYAQELQKTLDGMVHTNERGPDDALGRVVLARVDMVEAAGILALRAAAAVEINAARGGLEDLLAPLLADEPNAKPKSQPATMPTPASQPNTAMPAQLRYFNGFGGFTQDGREYAVVLRGGNPTPAPWINVIANPDFGFQVSAEGAGFCWSGNSQQNQLTPWSNDPVSNEAGDAVYLRDLDTGEVWSPLASSAPAQDCLYTCWHGQGYSRFACTGRGLVVETVQFVPRNGSVRVTRLTVRNTGTKPRRIAVYACARWALGAAGASTAFVQTWQDDATGAILARNPASADFGGRVAFLDMGGRQTSFTCDRREFLGRNGASSAPAVVVAGAELSGRMGPGLDACAALRTVIEVAPGQQDDVMTMLGQGTDQADVAAMVARVRGQGADALFTDVKSFWDQTLGALEVKTPDPAMDLIVNRWLLYQTLSCRMWGRAGFYQVSGAYGFRDQLQDCMAVCLSHPELARQQILRAASRQFEEGDVQHWWLPESGKGIRTRISDDKAWLGYVTAHYIETTGDQAILEELLPFLTAPPVPADRHDDFSNPGVAVQGASLYEHCARALDASLALGVNNLPLMGTGDWNDGMNRVGEGGKGESVWLGWFLHTTLARFVKLAELRGDGERAARWLIHMDTLRGGLENHAWDGAWYRRAFFDDGFALGSAANRECRIDSIAQSWAVISGVAQHDRAVRAMEAVDKYLVRPDDKIMTLFTPPFVSSGHDPGYIMGYPAGIRENGGQYTHGVLWGIIAHCMLGDGDKAGELFAMLNPINHARTRAEAEQYRVEPYVVSGDVYSVPPLAGRGGWSWYSGSAAWMYRTAVEYMLGIKLRGDRLIIDPVIPRSWPGFEATLRHKGVAYRIVVENPDGVCRGVAALEIDGAAASPQDGVTLDGSAAQQTVRVTLGMIANGKTQ